MRYRTGQKSCATPSPGSLVQTHNSLATTITAINLGGAGKGLQAGHWEAVFPEVPSVGPAATDIPPPPRRHPLTACRTRSRDRKRQAPNAKQPRRLGRRPFPPLLFLPAAAMERMPF